MALIGLVIFILIPIIEIAVLIKVSGIISFWTTLAIVIVTAIVGTRLLRQQGLALFANANNQLARGQLPLNVLVDAIGIAFAGALLLTPGFITDLFGFSLFIPPWRRFLAKKIANKFFMVGHWQTQADSTDHSSPDNGQSQFDDGAGPIIDGEFTHVKPDRTDKTNDRPSSSSPWNKPPKP